MRYLGYTPHKFVRLEICRFLILLHIFVGKNLHTLYYLICLIRYISGNFTHINFILTLFESLGILRIRFNSNSAHIQLEIRKFVGDTVKLATYVRCGNLRYNFTSITSIIHVTSAFLKISPLQRASFTKRTKKLAALKYWRSKCIKIYSKCTKQSLDAEI